jgi:hypothetical protein
MSCFGVFCVFLINPCRSIIYSSITVKITLAILFIRDVTSHFIKFTFELSADRHSYGPAIFYRFDICAYYLSVLFIQSVEPFTHRLLSISIFIKERTNFLHTQLYQKRYIMSICCFLNSSKKIKI